jgi:glutamate-1-semialdehyde 2,1-aminomutase
VSPDLASFAKAAANGYPLSFYCGKREFMSKLNDFVLTTTYAGETLSLAAAKATLSVMQKEPVHQHLYAVGERLQRGVEEAGNRAGVNTIAAGHPTTPAFSIVDENKEWQEKLNLAWRRQLFANGIFPHWFVNYSHKNADIDETIEKAEKAFRAALREA